MLKGAMSQLSQLRDLLYAMEYELGLTELTATERDVLLAFYAHAQPDMSGRMVCRTEPVRKHPTICRVSQPTFHRTLRRLLDRGLIERSDERRIGEYLLPDTGRRTG